MSKVYFLVGHHGVGKTFLINQLQSEGLSILHIDTGPIMRKIFKNQVSGISIGEWVKSNEKIYGKHFTDMILCQDIKGKVENCDKEIIFITGNRSLSGIQYIQQYFQLLNCNIIYLDTSFELMKKNYITRQKEFVDNDDFSKLLQKEISTGLYSIKDYVLNNPNDCMYLYKSENNDFFKNSVYSFIIDELNVLKRKDTNS